MTPLKTLVAAAVATAIAGPARAAELEVMHFWKSPSEQAALAEIRRAYEQRGGTWIDNAVKDYDTMRARLAELTAEGIAPGASQWSPEIEEADIVRLDIVQPIDPKVTAGWRNVVYPSVWDRIEHHGEVYFAPVGIHVKNMVWYNTRAFERAHLPLPETWEDIVASGPALRAAGVIPISMSEQAWIRDLLIHGLFAGTLGREQTLALKKDADSALKVLASPAFDEVLTRLAALRPLFSDPKEPRSWTDMADDVRTGRAAMTIMGDWIKPEFTLKGASIGSDIVCRKPPGNHWLASIVVDSFLMTKTDDPETVEAQRLFAETLMDPVTQAAFVARKGSTPPRVDVPASQLDECSRIVSASLADPTVATDNLWISLGLAASQQFRFALYDFLDDPSMTLEELRAKVDRIVAENGG